MVLEHHFGFQLGSFILHTLPVALWADSKLVRNSVLLLSEPLDSQVVSGESESGESV